MMKGHEDITYDLGTPRQYTQHGNWNKNCECGYPLGDGPDWEERYESHLKEVNGV